MTIKFIGDKFTATERVKTGLTSLDWSLGDALGNVGWPMGSFVEVYGDKNVGKTSFCLSIIAILASALERDVTVLDWEGQNQETVEQILTHGGFNGTVEYFLNVADEMSEDTAARYATRLYADPQVISLVDSLGAFRPTANLEGGLGDSNMGVFARETGRFADWIIAALQRSKAKGSVLATNHIHPTIGAKYAGTDTAGGVKKKYLAQLRINLKRTFLKTAKDPDDKESGSIVDFGHSWLMGGKIDSSRFGYSRREFNVFMIAGEGIHKGLTAVFDCIINGDAEVSSKKVTESTTVSIDGMSYKIGKMIDGRADEEMFYPFLNAIMAGEVSADVETPAKAEKPKRRKVVRRKKK